MVKAKWRNLSAQKKRRQIETGLKLGFRVLVLGLTLWLLVVIMKQLITANWDGKSRFNLVVAGAENLSLLSYNPVDDSSLKINLPGDLLIEVVGGYGLYPVKSIMALDKQEKKHGWLMTKSVGDYLGTEARGYIWGRKTNVNKWDLVRWWLKQLKIRNDRVEEWDLADTGAIKPATLPDGALVWETDEVKLTSLMSEWLFEEDLVREGARVIIVNHTGVEGLASSLARKLTVMGIRVVATETGGEAKKKSRLVTDRQWQKSKTIKALQQIYDFEVVREVKDERAEIVVELNEDFARLMKGT